MKVKLNDLKVDGVLIANPNDRDIYEKYIREISKLKPLTREEEQKLFKEYKETGDINIKQKLCKHNLLFVVSVAKRYSAMIPNSSLTLEDLVNEGNIGLCVAVDKFNHEAGNKFISYAVWWIRQTILTAIQYNVKTIRLPHYISGMVRKLEKKQSELEQKLQRTVTNIEIFDAMIEEYGESRLLDSVDSIDELMKMSNFELSLNRSLSIKNNEQNGLEFIDLIETTTLTPHEELEKKQRAELLNKMLSVLPEKTQNFFADYFGINGEKQMSLKEMSKKYGMTEAGIKANIDKHMRVLKNTNLNIGKHLFPTPDYEFNKKFKKDNDENTIYLI